MMKIFKVITGFGSNRRSIASKFYIFFHQNLKNHIFFISYVQFQDLNISMVLKYVRYDSWNDIYILVWIKNDSHVSSNFFFIKNLKKFRYFLKNFQFLSFIFSIWTWVCVLTAREYSLHIRLVIQCLSWAFLCMNFTAEEL